MSLRAAWVPFMASRKVASVRLRTFNPVAALNSRGLEARVLTRGEPSPDEVLVFQKAYSPAHLDLAVRHRSKGGVAVLDLCDNHFTEGESSPALVARSAQLRRMLEQVDLVSVCTPELGEMVPHPRVVSVIDALDPVGHVGAVGRVGQRHRRRRRVLWFGTAGAHDLPFGIRDLGRVLPSMGKAAAATPFELVVMSNSRKAFAGLDRPVGLPARYVPWGRRSFNLMASLSDVAILPVEVNDVTRGKTSNRVATAFQHGLAVVTDPLPSYLEFRDCVRFGAYAANVVEYLTSPAMRDEHVHLGRERVGDLYSVDNVVAQWTEALTRAQQVRNH